MTRHIRAIIFLILLAAGAAPLQSQGIKQVLESLAPAAGNSASPQDAHHGAASQIPWVEEQIQNARTRLELVRSDAFKEKVRNSGLPENRPAEILREAEEGENAWIYSLNLLQWISARDSVDSFDLSPPEAPSSTDAALTLERELVDLKNQLASLESDLAAQPENVARYEQETRSARRELAELRLEAQSPLAGTALDRSDVEILQATIREETANGQLYFQRWLGYRLELEIRQIKNQIARIEQVLRDSGYGQLLNAARASAEVARIEKTLPALDKDQQAASDSFDKAAARLAETKSRLDAATKDGDAPPPDLQEQAKNALADYTHQESLRGTVRARSYAVRQTMSLWNAALALLENTTLETLRKAREEIVREQPAARDLSNRIERLLSDKQQEIEKARQELRMPALPASERDALNKQIQNHQTATEKLLQLRKDASALITLQNRFLEEIDARIEAKIAEHRWAYTLQKIGSTLQGFWNFQIYEQGDREITLGTILTAILALAAALTASRLVARRITTLVERRVKLPGSRSHLVEKLTLYALSAASFLLVLQWMQIPLTIFAFLGGALAVGIGFGSQNLINNFISGLLLLLEQKINVGDLVEVDGNFGRVTDLGSRCSSIRKFDGVEVLVPNSSLLEKNVINWTLSDPMHRFDFRVGVAYGSDVDLVMRTLRESIEAQPEILRDPEPEVAFENFGDSTLDFHIFYWLEVGTLSSREVCTELRLRIVRLFRERGIEMAFPQRDVHLIPTRPLEIRLESPTPPP